jgi:hypothetical protein
MLKKMYSRRNLGTARPPWAQNSSYFEIARLLSFGIGSQGSLSILDWCLENRWIISFSLVLERAFDYGKVNFVKNFRVQRVSNVPVFSFEYEHLSSNLRTALSYRAISVAVGRSADSVLMARWSNLGIQLNSEWVLCRALESMNLLLLENGEFMNKFSLQLIMRSAEETRRKGTLEWYQQSFMKLRR